MFCRAQQAFVVFDMPVPGYNLPDALLLVNKARVLLERQRAAEAITCLHFVVGREVSPDQVHARLNGWILLGEAHEAQGNHPPKVPYTVTLYSK